MKAKVKSAKAIDIKSKAKAKIMTNKGWHTPLRVQIRPKKVQIVTNHKGLQPNANLKATT